MTAGRGIAHAKETPRDNSGRLQGFQLWVALRGGATPFRALLIGGAPFGETILMWWNFVARTPDEIREARDDWEAGGRFGEVRAYEGRRLAAPPLVARPVPANPMS